MSTSEPPLPALSEEDVDRLLTCFFEDELPAGLRSPRLVLPPASPRTEASRIRSGSRFAAVVLPAGLLCCLFGVALLLQPEPSQPSEAATSRMLPVSPDEFAAPRAPAPAPRVPGVEEQSHLVPAATAAGDSPQPPEIDVLIPELEVELFPAPPAGTR